MAACRSGCYACGPLLHAACHHVETLPLHAVTGSQAIGRIEGGLPAFGRHPSDRTADRRVRRRGGSTSTSGRIDAPDRQPEASGWRARRSSTHRANGWPGGRTVIEASSGSTAVSEATCAAAWSAVHCRDAAQHFGGEDRPDRVLRRALPFRRARRRGVMTRHASSHAKRAGTTWTQFTYAERATDWRGNNNIADSIFTRWPMAAPDTALDCGRCRHRRHQCHHRPLRALSPAR